MTSEEKNLNALIFKCRHLKKCLTCTSPLQKSNESADKSESAFKVHLKESDQ